MKSTYGVEFSVFQRYEVVELDAAAPASMYYPVVAVPMRWLAVALAWALSFRPRPYEILMSVRDRRTHALPRTAYSGGRRLRGGFRPGLKMNA